MELRMLEAENSETNKRLEECENFAKPDIIRFCEIEWAPQRYGGFVPQPQQLQFGSVPVILPTLFSTPNGESISSSNWHLTLNVGIQTLFSGADSACIPDHFILLWTGLDLESISPIKKLWFHIADRQLPVIYLSQMANRFRHPLLVFLSPFLLKESTYFRICAEVEPVPAELVPANTCRIIMLGTTFCKRYGDLIDYHPITEARPQILVPPPEPENDNSLHLEESRWRQL